MAVVVRRSSATSVYDGGAHLWPSDHCESVALPDDDALYIASCIKSNVREVEGR